MSNKAGIKYTIVTFTPTKKPIIQRLDTNNENRLGEIFKQQLEDNRSRPGGNPTQENIVLSPGYSDLAFLRGLVAAKVTWAQELLEMCKHSDLVTITFENKTEDAE